MATSPDSADAIIAEEFRYARATALQANEDRARVTGYFLATVGTVVAAGLGVNLDSGLPPPAALGFAALFGVLVWIGYATLRQLVALRLAWRESCRAMNQIKAHVLSGAPDLRDAVRWTDATLPPAYKPDSVASHQARVVTAVMGLAAASAAVLLWSTLGRPIVAGRQAILTPLNVPFAALALVLVIAAAVYIVWRPVGRPWWLGPTAALTGGVVAAALVLVLLPWLLLPGTRAPTTAWLISSATVALPTGLGAALLGWRAYADPLRAADSADDASSDLSGNRPSDGPIER